MKTMFRITLTMLLFLIVCLCITPAAFAETVVDSGTCGAQGDNLTWVLYDNGELIIEGTGEMENFEPDPDPNSLSCSYPWDSGAVQSVIIGSGVTSIGKCAFWNCRNLGSVTISNSVARIGVLAFDACKLTEVTIPGSVKNIERSAFCYCTSLTNVTLQSGVTSIGDAVFYGCDNLTDVSIPDTVTNIGVATFGNCSRLTDVYYSGTQKQWNQIEIGDYNDALTSATIHVYHHSVSSGNAINITDTTAMIPLTYTVDAADTYHTTSGECLVQLFLSEDPEFYLSTEGMNQALFRPSEQRSPATDVSFAMMVTGLNPDTTYYYRAYMIDKASIDRLAEETDGGVKSFTTKKQEAAVELTLGIPTEGTRFCFTSDTGGLYSLTSDADSGSIKVNNSQSIQIAEDYRFALSEGPLNTIFFAPAGEMLYFDVSAGVSPITLHYAVDTAPVLTLDNPVTAKGSRAYCFKAPKDGSYTITASGTMGALGIANMETQIWDTVQGNMITVDLNKDDRVYMKWNGNPRADIEYIASGSTVMTEIEAVDQNGDIRAQMQAIYANNPDDLARVMKTNDPDVISTIRSLEENAAGGSTSVTITSNVDPKITQVSVLGAGLNATTDGGPAALVVDKASGQHNVPAADQFRTLSFSLTLSNVSGTDTLAFPIAVDFKLNNRGIDRNRLTLYHYHADGTVDQVPVNVYPDPSGDEWEWYAKIYLTGLSDFVMVYTDESGGESDAVIMIPESVTAIEDEAFMGSAVEYVVVPAGVRSVGARAFANCEKLTTVEFLSNTVSVDPTAFENSPNVQTIYPAEGK